MKGWLEMTKSKQRQSLSGTVLIMILTVMFVLIIMLMATLTVVTTASQRIYTKFEENQAYYTSRSALEVFTENMLIDSDYLYSDGVQQGYQIQKALYSIKSQDGNDEKTDLGDPTLTDAPSYIEYKVTLPKVAVGDDAYGDFADDVTIKMEVLERTYDPNPKGRAKDKMTIKVTATSLFNGVEGSASVILKAGPSVNIASRAVTSLGTSKMTMDNFVLLGGLATNGDAKLGNTGDIWGNVYYGGTCDNSGGGTKITLVGNQVFYIKGGVTGTQNAFPVRGVAIDDSDGVEDENKGEPLVFVDGNYDITQSQSYDETQPVAMVITGDFKTTGEFKHSGDLFVMGDFILSGDGSASEIFGDLYLAMNKASSSDNTAELTLGSTLTVHGDIHLVDKSKIGDMAGKVNVGGKIHMPYENGDSLPDGIDASKYDFNTQKSAKIVRDEDTKTVEVELPGVAKKTINVDDALFNQYRRNKKFDENWISSSEYAFTDEEELKKDVDPTDSKTYAKYSDERIHEYIAKNIGGATSITSNKGGSFGTGKYVMDPGQYMQNVIFTGGATDLFLKPGYYSRGGSGGKVIVDCTELNVYLVPGYYDFTDFCFTTSKVESGDNLYVGDYAPKGKTLVNVPTTFYAEGTTNIKLNNSATYIIGHIYAPYGAIDGGSSGSSSLSNRIYYNTEKYTGSHQISIIGSVLAELYNPGDSSKGGVAFVNPQEETTPPPGITFLKFKEVKYSR